MTPTVALEVLGLLFALVLGHGLLSATRTAGDLKRRP